MEWKLSDDRKKEYEGFLKAAQEIELLIGSTQFRVSKMLKSRADIDAGVKLWWDKISEELKLDKTKDYMMNAEGIVKEVPRENRPQQSPIVVPVPAAGSNVGTKAEELK